ncbi:MAG: hypothetical protein AAF449_02630 [Myxococcota bacterium]
MSSTTHSEPNSHDVDLLVQVFDASLLACHERDLSELKRCLGLLKTFIDFDHSSPTMAWGVFQIYRHCECLAANNDFVGSATILSYLQRLWVDA